MAPYTERALFESPYMVPYIYEALLFSVYGGPNSTEVK